MVLRRKFNGAKVYTEAWEAAAMRFGRRAFCAGRSCSESGSGQYKSENAGMSSEKYVRIILAENLRFLGKGSSAPSKSGAKARPRGVVDAHTVDIP